MANGPALPTVDVGVALIASGDRILVVFNERWGSFTLPMSKRRVWAHPEQLGATADEEWIDAAARAAAEVLGKTCRPEAQAVLKASGERQSDANGVLKEYHFQVFRVEVDADAPIVAGVIAEWLTVDQIRGGELRPISVTAVRILEMLRRSDKV